MYSQDQLVLTDYAQDVSVFVMETVPAKQIGIWILAVLSDELERDPSPLTCQTSSVLLGPLKAKYDIDDADLDRGIRFLVDQQMINACNRPDGRAILPNQSGIEFLAENSEKKPPAKQAERPNIVENVTHWFQSKLVFAILIIIILGITALGEFTDSLEKLKHFFTEIFHKESHTSAAYIFSPGFQAYWHGIDGMPHWEFDIILKNEGATLASEIQAFFASQLVDGDLPQTPLFPAPEKQTGLAVALGSDKSSTNFIVQIPGNKLVEVSAGRKNLFLWGHVLYKDAFSESHTFSFTNMVTIHGNPSSTNEASSITFEFPIFPATSQRK